MLFLALYSETGSQLLKPLKKPFLRYRHLNLHFVSHSDLTCTLVGILEMWKIVNYCAPFYILKIEEKLEDNACYSESESIRDEEEEAFEDFNSNEYQLSELELLRQENMKKNLELFEEFQINQVSSFCLTHY